MSSKQKFQFKDARVRVDERNEVLYQRADGNDIKCGEVVDTGRRFNEGREIIWGIGDESKRRGSWTYYSKHCAVVACARMYLKARGMILL